MKYVLREGAHLQKEDAQEIGEAIERLLKERDGQLRPEDVVEDSKNPLSIFNKYIHWDDESAANKWRIHQARNIINSIRIVIEDIDSKPLVNAFVNITVLEQGKRYIAVKTAMNNKEYYKQLLDEARYEIEMWYKKYNLYPSLKKIMGDIEGPLEMIKRKLQL